MAIAQSRQVAGMITERTGRPAEIVGVMTLGDVSRAQLTQIGGTGVSASALREALLAGEVDLAVHSLKDLPAGPAPGIVLAAVPPRDDPRDALAARDGAKLADLPAGARIGTGGQRRMSGRYAHDAPQSALDPGQHADRRADAQQLAGGLSDRGLGQLRWERVLEMIGLPAGSDLIDAVLPLSLRGNPCVLHQARMGLPRPHRHGGRLAPFVVYEGRSESADRVDCRRGRGV